MVLYWQMCVFHKCNIYTWPSARQRLGRPSSILYLDTLVATSQYSQCWLVRYEYSLHFRSTNIEHVLTDVSTTLYSSCGLCALFTYRSLNLHDEMLQLNLYWMTARRGVDMCDTIHCTELMASTCTLYIYMVATDTEEPHQKGKCI